MCSTGTGVRGRTTGEGEPMTFLVANVNSVKLNFAHPYSENGDDVEGDVLLSSEPLEQVAVPTEHCPPELMATGAPVGAAAELGQSVCTTTSELDSGELTAHFVSLSIGTTPTTDYKAPFFPPYYINVLEEISNDNTHLDGKVKELLDQYYMDTGDTIEEAAVMSKPRKGTAQKKPLESERKKCSGQSAGEAYEKAMARHGDVTFQKLHKQLQKCPRQILR